MPMNYEVNPQDERTIRDFYEAPSPEARARAYDKLRQRMRGADAAVFGKIHSQVRDRLVAEHQRKYPPTRTTWNPDTGRTETRRA